MRALVTVDDVFDRRVIARVPGRYAYREGDFYVVDGGAVIADGYDCAVYLKDVDRVAFTVMPWGADSVAVTSHEFDRSWWRSLYCRLFGHRAPRGMTWGTGEFCGFCNRWSDE